MFRVLLLWPQRAPGTMACSLAHEPGRSPRKMDRGLDWVQQRQLELFSFFLVSNLNST